MKLWTLLVAILLVFTISGCATSEKQNEDTDKQSNEGPNYMIMFEEHAEGDYTVTQEDLQIIRNEGGIVIERFSAIGIVSAKLTEKQAEILRKNERILHVEKYQNKSMKIQY